MLNAKFVTLLIGLVFFLNQATFATLQSQILDFTKRLHTAEVERRDLRIELSTLRHERQNWLKSTTNSQHMSSQIDNFREQVIIPVAGSCYNFLYTNPLESNLLVTFYYTVMAFRTFLVKSMFLNTDLKEDEFAFVS